jgi:putative membrane protein
MGGMMAGAGTTYAWAVALILVAVAMAAVGGVVAARVLRARHNGSALPDNASQVAMADAAKEALRMRYARGEVSREEYLQGKVELED